MRISDEELQNEKEIMVSKRNIALHKLSTTIENGTVTEMENSFKEFIRVHKQWMLIDDALAVYKI